MTCGIWKRSLPLSGFIILAHPGKPWGCPLLCRPFAPSPATGGRQGEGMRHWVAMPWTLAVSVSFCSEGSSHLLSLHFLVLNFPPATQQKNLQECAAGKALWGAWGWVWLLLVSSAHCSLSVPCRVRAGTCGAFALLGFIGEMFPFPVSLVQIFGWVDWEVPICVSAHCHLDRTEKRNWRTH